MLNLYKKKPIWCSYCYFENLTEIRYYHAYSELLFLPWQTCPNDYIENCSVIPKAEKKQKDLAFLSASMALSSSKIGWQIIISNIVKPSLIIKVKFALNNGLIMNPILRKN